MQHRARMRIESDHSGNGAGLTRPFHDGAHDQLMAQMQSIKHAERQHRRSLNLGVVSSVEKRIS